MKTVSVSRGRWFIGFVVYVAAAAGLAGCARVDGERQDASLREYKDYGGGVAEFRLYDGTRCVTLHRAGITCDWAAAR